jgi:hypothetical protein
MHSGLFSSELHFFLVFSLSSYAQWVIEIKSQCQPIDLPYIQQVKLLGVKLDSIAKFLDKSRLQDGAAIAIYQLVERFQRGVE